MKNYNFTAKYADFLKRLKNTGVVFKNLKTFTRIYRENSAKYLEKVSICIYRGLGGGPPERSEFIKIPD